MWAASQRRGRRRQAWRSRSFRKSTRHKPPMIRLRHDGSMDDIRTGQVIRAIRLDRGLTQEELGIASGTSRFIVARIESGRLRGIPIGKVRAVANALGAQLDLNVRWNG